MGGEGKIRSLLLNTFSLKCKVGSVAMPAGSSGEGRLET